MKSLILAGLLGLSFMAQASWLDPNSIRKDLAPIKASQSNMSETEFNGILANIQKSYEPLVANLGGKLNVSGNWKDEKLNAAAGQMFGTWRVIITGGLARRPELTPDAFTLILCHELGHHLGGFAIAPQRTPFEAPWASNEGQADYFSTQVCARKIWGADLEVNAGFRDKASDKVRLQCDSVWFNIEDQNLCYRTLAAVKSMTTTMAVLTERPIPELETPDESKVDQTDHGHPMPQCRMDTAVQGALCMAAFNEGLIPGKGFNPIDSGEAEEEAALFSCTHLSGFSVGLRPACWFKSRM